MSELGSTALLLNCFYIVASYLIGSLSTAIIVCKIGGYPDPRSEGSNNPGATNVLRVAGKPAAALTLVGDVLKGVIPVALAIHLNFAPIWVTLIAAAAFLGHLLPVFFKFQGGKGVATALGILHVISWPAGICTLGVWLTVFVAARISSLSSIVSWAIAPAFVFWFAPDYVLGIAIIALAIIWRHKSNILDLLAGEERAFKEPNKQ